MPGGSKRGTLPEVFFRLEQTRSTAFRRPRHPMRQRTREPLLCSAAPQRLTLKPATADQPDQRRLPAPFCRQAVNRPLPGRASSGVEQRPYSLFRRCVSKQYSINCSLTALGRFYRESHERLTILSVDAGEINPRHSVHRTESKPTSLPNRDVSHNCAPLSG